MNYPHFFKQLTGHKPYPYQRALGDDEFPELLDIPTGLGKTAAVGVAWLYKQLIAPDTTPRRLVYCLPMRTLVEQTRDEFRTWVERAMPHFEESGLLVPDVSILMGGDRETTWAEHPERPAAIIGTQDMLLSRALMRGYGMNRFSWPIDYGLLHNDVFWVFDETQLMGVALETSAQLQAFRDELGTAQYASSMWMSATLLEDQLSTIDHPEPTDGWRRHSLTDTDRDLGEVRDRTTATKRLVRAHTVVPSSTSKANLSAYSESLAAEIVDAHVDGTLTLVVANQVRRARLIYESIIELDDRDASNTALIHSRFRAPDRQQSAQLLHETGDRIVVATQVVEAGVDVSARTLFTELAPWSSVVQRIGRCNRYGEHESADVFWVDIEYNKERDGTFLPYTMEQLDTARELLTSEELDDVGPQSLTDVDVEPTSVIRPVLRRKDLLDLFDTTPDLSGDDIDVSRFIRDGEDTDVLFYWRRWGDGAPPDDISAATRDEFCRVSVGAANKFIGKNSVTAWRWDALEGRWQSVRRGAIPGQSILLHSEMGGYTPTLGWTGERRGDSSTVEPLSTGGEDNREMDDDDRTDVGRWIELAEHLRHVRDSVNDIAAELDLSKDVVEALDTAARWHDVGKAHWVFQQMLVGPLADHPELMWDSGSCPWAKSNHRKGQAPRRHFRHELASALAYLDQHGADEMSDLVAYLIASHHGKVRVSIRSLPGEDEPEYDETPPLFARGVWDGDVLAPVQVPDEGRVGPIELDLSPMLMGRGSWLERVLELRDSPEVGPFRLGWLEALLRIADRRASADEKASATDHESRPEESKS